MPEDHKTIQAAIDASQPGDTIRVAAGKYSERIRLKPGIIVRSDGDDTPGVVGLRRAEATIIDGGGKVGEGPGVRMTEGSTLDGFTITNVGVYDEAIWKKHHATQGEELGDEEGAVQAEGTTPAISITGISCTVSNTLVHHNGDVGIGILGTPKATTAPLITNNRVYRNMGGGIGVAEGAEPIVRGNHCYENLRAGIGCRSSNPIVTGNTCSQNIRAGIGCREGAKPTLRGMSVPITDVQALGSGWKEQPRWWRETHAATTRWPESAAAMERAPSCGKYLPGKQDGRNRLPRRGATPHRGEHLLWE